MKARVETLIYGPHMKGKVYPVVGESQVNGQTMYELEAKPKPNQLPRRYLFWEREVTIVEEVS